MVTSQNKVRTFHFHIVTRSCTRPKYCDSGQTLASFFKGGKYRKWKKRYFVFKGSSLQYFANKGDTVAKGNIDLGEGLGIRKRNQCSLEWPKDAKNGLCFGLATENRTYYLYGTDKTEIE